MVTITGQESPVRSTFLAEKENLDFLVSKAKDIFKGLLVIALLNLPFLNVLLLTGKVKTQGSISSAFSELIVTSTKLATLELLASLKSSAVASIRPEIEILSLFSLLPAVTLHLVIDTVFGFVEA